MARNDNKKNIDNDTGDNEDPLARYRELWM